MDRSVNFYTKTLGLKLVQRFGNHWASVEAGKLTIGLHPASAENAAGRNGSTVIGLELEGDIDELVSYCPKDHLEVFHTALYCKETFCRTSDRQPRQ